MTSLLLKTLETLMSSIPLFTKLKVHKFAEISFFGDMTLFDLKTFIKTKFKTVSLMELSVAAQFDCFLKK